MGTSGAYGGSDRQSWSRARQRYRDVLRHQGEDAVSDCAGAIADALADEDEELVQPVEQVTPISALGVPGAMRRRVTGDGSAGVPAGETLVQGRTAVAGRMGGGSSRRVVRAAQRGALAIGAAYALHTGDREALADVGLSLDELNAMTPREQRLTLLDAVLGDAAHPDDVALRQAADEFLKSVLSDRPPTPLDAIRRFVAVLIYRLGMVELKRQLKEEGIDSRYAARTEAMIREWIDARLAREDFRVRGRLVRLRDFQRVATRLMKAAISILQAVTR